MKLLHTNSRHSNPSNFPRSLLSFGAFSLFPVFALNCQNLLIFDTVQVIQSCLVLFLFFIHVVIFQRPINSLSSWYGGESCGKNLPIFKLQRLECQGQRMVNPRLAETGILKSEPETKKCNDLIEKQISDRETQNLRLRDPLVGCARFRDLGRICRDFSFFRGPFTTPNV